MNVGPTVHVISYYKEREEDTKFVLNTLSAVDGSGSVLIKPPPNHLRRRSTSIRKFKIPRHKIINNCNHQSKKMKVDFKDRCRKHKRRHGFMFSERSLHRYEKCERPLWLETHIWHSKRMMMKSLWGFRLPYYNCGKGIRFMGRALKSQAIMHDSSYIRPVEICSKKNVIIEVLLQFMDPQSPFFSQNTENYQHEYDIHLHRRYAFPRDCLGPAKINFVQLDISDKPLDGLSKVWLWLHPAIFDYFRETFAVAVREVEAQHTSEITEGIPDPLGEDSSHPSDSTSSVAVGMVPGGIIRFQIRGLLSSKILSRILFPVPGSTSSSSVAPSSASRDDSRDLEGVLTASASHPNRVLFLRIRDVRSIRFRPLGVTVIIPSENTSYQDKPIESETKIGGKSLESVYEDSIRTQSTQAVLATAQILATSTTSHPLSIPIALIRKVSSSYPEESYADSYITSSPWTRYKRDFGETHGVARSDAEHLSGWDLVAPAGWGNALWRALIFSGCRAVGLKEMEQFTLETGSRAFPRDYPDTKAGRVYWREKANLHLMIKKDKGSRLNGHEKAVVRRSKRRRWAEDRTSVHIPWKQLIRLHPDPVAEKIMHGVVKEDVANGTIPVPARNGGRREYGATGFLVVSSRIHASAFQVPIISPTDPLVDQTNSYGWECPHPLPPLARPTLLPVRVWVVGRGVLQTGTELFAPSLTGPLQGMEKSSLSELEALSVGGDVGAWITGVKCSLSRQVVATAQGYGLLGHWRGVEYSVHSGDAISSQRVLLGFLTSGGISKLSGYSLGIGFCHAEKLHKIQRELFLMENCYQDIRGLKSLRLTALVMFRNPGSNWIRPAFLEITS